jgi:hypothetical protein
MVPSIESSGFFMGIPYLVSVRFQGALEINADYLSFLVGHRVEQRPDECNIIADLQGRLEGA